MRLEMLGTSFVPQHSDARVLEQVIYKWRHSRREIASSLLRRYRALELAGRPVLESEIERDAQYLLRDSAVAFLRGSPKSPSLPPTA